MNSPSGLGLRIGDLRVDPAIDTIYKDGTTIKLEPRTMRLLVCLAERVGQVVGIDELLDHVWKDVVVSPESVYQAIATLRRTLGDDPKNPTYIANVMRRGYRVVAPVAPWVDVSVIQSAAAPFEGAPTVVEEPAEAVAQRESRAEPASAGATGSSPVIVVARSRWRLVATRWRWPQVVAALLILSGAVLIFAIRHATHLAGPIMLAVLPFVNLSGDPQQEYFVDGLTEEMIAQMGGLDPAHLGVIARTTTMQYKGAHKDVAQIARELGVDFILEGSVRKDGGRVRITGQLIQASGQTHLWAGSYDGDLSDILRLQSAVASGIAGKIRLTLSSETQDRVSRAPAVNADAHEAYLRGLQAADLRTKEGIRRSIADFSRAIAIDPNYAPAYAALARTYSLAQVFGGGMPAESMPKARDAALHALELDDSVAEAHATLAFVRAHFEYDWPAAEHEFRRALDLNPSDAQTHFFYSNSYLSPFGRHDEAIAEMHAAVELDPLSIPIQVFVGRTYLWARRYHEALAELEKAEQMNPNVAVVQERLAHLYTYTGEYDKAIAAETRARVLAGETAETALRKEGELRAALTKDGPRGYWQVVLSFAQSADNPPEAYTTSYGRAIVFARLGEHEKAFAELDRAYTERQLAMTEIAVEPAFDGLHADRQFSDLVRRVGLSR